MNSIYVHVETKHLITDNTHVQSSILSFGRNTQDPKVHYRCAVHCVIHSVP